MAFPDCAPVENHQKENILKKLRQVSGFSGWLYSYVTNNKKPRRLITSISSIVILLRVPCIATSIARMAVEIVKSSRPLRDTSIGHSAAMVHRYRPPCRDNADDNCIVLSTSCYLSTYWSNSTIANDSRHNVKLLTYVLNKKINVTNLTRR